MDPRQAQFGRTMLILRETLEKSEEIEDLVAFNARKTNKVSDKYVTVELVPSDGDDGDEGTLVAVPRVAFAKAASGQKVLMGPGTTDDDAANFKAWCGQFLIRQKGGGPSLRFKGRFSWTWVPEVFSAIGYAHMGGVYAHHPRCRVLQLRHLQRTRPYKADLWTVAFTWSTVPTSKKHLFAPLRTSENKFRYRGHRWPTSSRITSRGDFEALLAAWDASDATLTPRERWALIGSALAFETWPCPRVLCDMLVVALTPGCAADRRFREVVPARVLGVTTVEGWPVGVDSTRPWFVPEGRYLEISNEIRNASSPDAFEALTVFGDDGGRLRGVVSGGCVASIMSTHWLAPEEACPGSVPCPVPCPDECPCRRSKDVDVFTTNKSYAGVTRELEDVPGIDITETPFASVARLFMSADFTHNQGALLVGPDGALWVAGSPYAFASWATMHTLATGARCRTGRTAVAAAKGFTVQMCGVKETPERPYHPSDGNPKSRVCW